MSIKRLNKETVKLINSTQVITSIYSAIKELVENSLDAQAQNIEINLVDNGLTLIEVKDNGFGISKEDAQYMGLSSYTSKITAFNDLDLLSTYGFRGEGLSSICQIADVTVCTKTANDETVTCYKMDNEGNVISSEITHGLKGTTVKMNNLFKNFPVRRNILNNKKRINQEMKAIEVLLKNYAICKPSIRFVFRVNGNSIFMKPSAKNLIEAVKYVLGMQIYSKLYHVQKVFDKTEIELFVPKKTIKEDLSCIVQAGLQFVCVNDRPIKSKELEKLINKRLSEYYCETSRKYIFCLILKVEPSSLDINLEPNKDKVFLQNEITILSELDNILLEYYNLQSSQSQNDIENIDVNSLKKKVSSPKKRKIDTNDSNDVVANEIIASKPEEIVTKTNEEFLKTLSQPALSDVDSDDEFKKKSIEKNNQMENLESSIFNFTDESLNKYKMDIINEDNNEERLSQLPVVDLGEDFDWQDIVNKCNQKLKEKESEESEFPDKDTNDLMWSKGQIPGINGGVKIVSLNNISTDSIGQKSNDQNLPINNLDINQINDNDVASTSENNTPNIKFVWEPIEKESKKLTTKSKSITPSSASKRKKIEIDPNQTKIPFAGDDACLSVMGPSAFSMYCRKIRNKIIEEQPGLTPAEVAAELNKGWKNISAEERVYYRDLASQLKAEEAPSPRTNVTLKKPKSLISEFEKEKNRKQLVNMLENMKSNKAELKNESMLMRTYVPWSTNLSSLTVKFKKLVTCEIPIEKPKSVAIVGSLDRSFWIVRLLSKLCVFDVSELCTKLNLTDINCNRIDEELAIGIVNKWLTEKEDLSVFHPFQMLETIYND